ncbi:hypothetical protein [Alteromonas naphthalenivorans]|uniref:Uncharacterized protein n=1 Tax=Alteromonas naphthalenivorans TaxID=715451 RepID=F5ZCV8_ALTNA|nr:hypothetical protein [Alteromonas naphthalenivorans]AEF03720.1 hypothetical protein ambt_10990 [Alteromonas naphthalenivorans]
MQHGKFSSKLEIFYTDIEKILSDKPKSQERFEKEFDDLIKKVALNANQKGRRGQTIDEEALTAMLETDNEVKFPRSQLVSSYLKVCRDYKKLSDQESRLSKFDFKERVRFLIFRICTAIGIAAVILGTAIVAKELGIALPLSSLKSS